jgi:hypothetical protein
MTIEGVDYSSARPKPADLVAAGKKFVVRYCPYQVRVNGVLQWVQKGLTASEITALRAAGLDLVFNFESIAGRMKQGGTTAIARANGIADAKLVEAAIARLAMPAGTVCYFSADWDATPGDQTLIDAYLGGAASVMGIARVGVYAGYWVIKRCVENKTASWFWQTYAWSGGHLHPSTHIYQYNNGERIAGSSVDLDRALKPAFGQWAHAPIILPDTSEEPPLDLYSTPGRMTATVTAGTPHFDGPAGKQTGVITDPTIRFDVILQDKPLAPDYVLIDGASGDTVKYPSGVICRWVKASALQGLRPVIREPAPVPVPTSAAVRVTLSSLVTGKVINEWDATAPAGAAPSTAPGPVPPSTIPAA